MNTSDVPEHIAHSLDKGIHILDCAKIAGTSSHIYREVTNNILQGNINKVHTRCPTPLNLTLKLKIHQQRILHEMIQKEQLTYRVGNKLNMFVLSDKVGSGKSVDILALICKYPTLDDSKYLNMNHINYKIPKMFRHFKGLILEPTVVLKTNLIVIPHNIFHQWASYIKDYTNLTVYLINNRKKIQTLDIHNIEQGLYNIILVKSTMYNDLMNHIYSRCPKKKCLNILDSDYKDIYAVKTLSHDIDNLVCRSLYNLNDSFDSRIVEKFNSLKKTVQNMDIEGIISKMNQSGQNVDEILKYTGPLFERVIIDEANSIKIPSCKCAYGKINWFITSSVEDLLYPWGKYNHTHINGVIGSGFIKDTFTSNCHRYLLPSIQNMYLKNNDHFVEESFGLPEPIKKIITCWTPPELLVLKGIAAPEVIHALNAGDMSSAIQMTNCKVSNETDIIDSTLNYLYKSLQKYTQMITDKHEIKNEILLHLQSMNSNGNSPVVLNGAVHVPIDEDTVKEFKKKLTNIKISLKNYTDKQTDIEFKITSLKERISNIKDKTCPICISTVQNPCLTDCCKNIFCMTCYIQALEYSNQKCPHCRAPNRHISNVTLIHNDIEPTTQIDVPTLPKKSEELIRIIKHNPKGRFLVFSEYNNTFHNVIELLNENNIQYNKLSGSSGRITNIIEDYSLNKISVLLLNAKYYGSGLNLQMTTDIIIYHKMSHDLENQVIGRGQRLGRTGALNVHYLYYENENNENNN